MSRLVCVFAVALYVFFPLLSLSPPADSSLSFLTPQITAFENRQLFNTVFVRRPLIIYQMLLLMCSFFCVSAICVVLCAFIVCAFSSRLVIWCFCQNLSRQKSVENSAYCLFCFNIKEWHLTWISYYWKIYFLYTLIRRWCNRCVVYLFTNYCFSNWFINIISELFYG